MLIDVKRIKRHWQLYLIFLLPLAHTILFKYMPMYGITLAFKEFNPLLGIMGSPWVGMKYMNQFFASPYSLTIIGNTLKISVYALLAGFPIPILLAIALNEVSAKRFKKTVQMVTYAPYFISTVVLVGIILQITDLRNGIINNLIKALGGSAINFMGRADLFTSIYVWSGVWQSAGYSSIIFLAALAGVNPELHEAAIVDGANRIQRIFNIDIPAIKSTIVILLILNLGNILGVGFEKIFLMQNNINLSASEVISTYVYKVGLQQANYSFSTAVNLFNTLASFIMVVLSNYTAKRVTGSSMW